MNYTGVTMSNYVEVEDKEHLQNLVNRFQEEDLGYFQTFWEEDQFAIGVKHGTIRVEEDYVDEFLTQLGLAIAEPMVIRSVGYEGLRGIPDAWQWVVYPDGDWEVERLDGPKNLGPNFIVDGRFTSEGLSLSVYTEGGDVVEEVWFTYDEMEAMQSDEESHFTFEL